MDGEELVSFARDPSSAPPESPATTTAAGLSHVRAHDS